MAGNANAVDVRQPNKLMGYFVPIEQAAFVTEVLELAFRETDGITVYAGLFDKILNQRCPPTIAQPDSDFLPDMEASEIENSDGGSKRKRRKVNTKWTVKKRKTGDRRPRCSGQCCEHQVAPQLIKLGESVLKPNGATGSPELPYPVPNHPHIHDLGVARKVVQIGCKDLLSPLQELLPIERPSQTDTEESNN